MEDRNANSTNTEINSSASLSSVNDGHSSSKADDNEISVLGKRFAGIALILATFLSGFYLIGHWPDQLAKPSDFVKPLYTYDWFNVRLVGIPDTGRIRYFNDSLIVVEEAGLVNLRPEQRDTVAIPIGSTTIVLDSLRRHNDSLKASWAAADLDKRSSASKTFPPESRLMHINTLLLILVAVAGFLGNMIYVATSFTTFIGNRQYRRSWGLWYFVKPFTAAALAVAVYFVFRGGFLNMSDDSTNINLYGLMTISILAGLFTDRTTLKLKEVFDVLLRPKEERKDSLEEAKPQITDIVAPPLEAGKPTTITIRGKNLDKAIIQIEGKEPVIENKQASGITFTYTLPPELKDKDIVKLEVFDDKGLLVPPVKELKVHKYPTVANTQNTTGGDGQSQAADENQEEFGDADAEDQLNKPQD